jgi:hypothetical protein
MMISSVLLSAVCLLRTAHGHGRLTVPTTRRGDIWAYENDPIGFDQHGTQPPTPPEEFVCRHDVSGSTPVTPYTAGQQIDITWVNSALHVGDAAVYISYDYDLPMSRNQDMEFFKIANIWDAKTFSASSYPITLPEWLPAGRATLRWEWYALHNNPIVERYVQCAEIEIAGLGGDVEKTVAEIPKYRVWDGTTSLSLPEQNNAAMTLYRDAGGVYGPEGEFQTGPECAFCGVAGNNCELSDVGTEYHVDMGTGASPCDHQGTQAPTDPVTDAPTDPATDAPTDPATADPTEPTNGRKFYLDSSSDLNTKKSLANIGGLLAQCAWESGGDAPWSACDENNYTNWPNDANPDKQAACSQRHDGIQYKDLTGPLPGGCPVDPQMTMTAETFATWTPGPLQCVPGSETEGCCWWGRGAIQTTGPYNYGRLQAEVIANMAGMEDVSLCTNPEAICQRDELKFIGAAYYWTTVVQEDQCFDSALDLYADNFDNNAAGPSGCSKFSMGVGGSINNGMWNQMAHQDAKRQTLFVNYMNELETAFTDYDNAPPSFECTGDEKIDRMLELSNLKSVTGMDSSPVYTWYGFCTALRELLGEPVVPGPTDAPVAPAPTPTDAPVEGQCTTLIGDGQGCGGDLQDCCQPGLLCYTHSNGWMGCWPQSAIDQDQATAAPTDPTTTEEPTTTTTEEATTTTTEEATTTTTEEATTTTTEEATTTTTEATTTTTDPTDASCEDKIWGAQCNGEGFTGSTCCPSGMECQWRSNWFAGCRATTSPCGTGPTADWICDPPAGRRM